MGPRRRCGPWPPGDRSTLKVWSHGAWRYAPVRARQDFPDGRVVYQVDIDLRGDTSVTTRSYAWPQPGLRREHGTRTPG
ncbi:hypothetical protein GCM10023329_00240 [Streptomyces sanyensis]|uniref:Uncharacterized protein n=1 Tax=Streptomyces sanyensis TaxID=568869 RepID=A0ABP8ZL30_9ACTN